jgi:cytoskeleton protein RodZ
MNALSQKLKEAREARGITLTQISDITRIAETYLEAIEQGTLSVLPPAYVRAFIREYASIVGLNVDEAMRLYDEAVSGPSPKPPAPPPPAAPAPPVPDSPVPGTGLAPEKKFMTPATTRIALSLLGIAALAIIIWNMTGNKATPPAEEVPFQKVIKEQERRLSPVAAPAPAAKPATPPAAKADSLTLRAVTTDSVWLLIVVDQGEPREYLLPAGAKVSWRGRERFTLTLGNAGAAEFTLNQKQLGTLGKKGTVIRGFEVNRQTLSSR